MMGQFSVVQNKRNPVFKWAPVMMDDMMTLAPYPLPEGSVTY